MNQQRSRVCPLCDCAEYRTRLSIPHDGLMYRIADCSNCGFTYVPTLFTATYRAEEPPPGAPPKKRRYHHIKRLCDRLLAPAQRKWTVVEIGAGWGGLGSLFSVDARYDYRGFEPSASRAAYCRERGLNVVNELFAAGSARNVDAVILDNVAEHVEEPRKLLRDAVDALAPGGVLIVIVPNVRDIRQLHPRWRARHHWQPRCHINYFSAHSLQQLLQAHGMDCRYFGFECLGGAEDLPVLPRVVSDKLGLHLLGLNCYGVKRPGG